MKSFAMVILILYVQELSSYNHIEKNELLISLPTDVNSETTLELVRELCGKFWSPAQVYLVTPISLFVVLLTAGNNHAKSATSDPV